MKRSLYLLSAFLWLSIMIFWGCSKGPTSRPSGPKEADVKEWVEKFGPLLILHPYEKYQVDDPEYVLDNGVSLKWGIVHMSGSKDEDKYNSFKLENVQSMPTSFKTLIRRTNPKFQDDDPDGTDNLTKIPKFNLI